MSLLTVKPCWKLLFLTCALFYLNADFNVNIWSVLKKYSAVTQQYFSRTVWYLTSIRLTAKKPDVNRQSFIKSVFFVKTKSCFEENYF